jgi:peptidyl-prolyl cis-trans isomerase C
MDGHSKNLSAIGGLVPPIVLVAVLVLVAACERRPVGHDDPGGGSGPVVARINGQPLYRRELDAYLPEADRQEATAEDRSASFERWVSTQLLYDEAQRTGLQLSREVDWQLEQYRRDLVADRLVQEVLKERAVVTRSEVMAYYVAHKDEFNLEVRVSHILTNNLQDAEEALEMLKTRPFKWVVAKMSVDKHTGVGGDLGYLSKGNMPPEFEKVVFKMKVGEVSQIVESEFGYHILKLTDVRAALNELPFEAVAPEISRELLLRKRAAVYDSLITTLRANASIRVIDPDLGYAIEMADSMNKARASETGVETGGFTRAISEPHSASRDTTMDDSGEGE